ncbi:two-component system sensor histidine kinase YesM [Paenibacillus sp. V4I3]|uniref:sensor histidine kinase n=1 Tax=unclassified Paenibacillus TaxID=185978 RepID=UPI00277F2EAB|nr:MULTISPECIES: sensor histidine kinase [unclassified Paenibacillus]MDQ0877126.1 two-component system sensor histidine kinase YesM [Paenibacillus sp. V4I3]MDQ0886993.1 two-component system sensor histidine kinase YesM [Paenibacillus sp. V4I9]
MQFLQKYITMPWFRNQRIRYKIIMIYFPLIFVPLFVLGFVSNQVYTNAIVKKTIKNVSDNSSLIITRITGMLTNVESCANMLTINLNKLIVEDPQSQGAAETSLQMYTQITNQLSFALLVFPDVQSAAFIDANGRVFGSNLLMERNRELIASSEMLKQVDASIGNKNIWFPMQQRNYLTPDSQEIVMTLGKRIVNIYTGQQLGMLVLNIKESSLSAIYQKIGSIQDGSYFIVNEGGVVISSQHPEDLLQEVADPTMKNWITSSKDTSDLTSFQHEKTLVVSSDVPSFGWKLISMAPLESLTADTRKITILIVLIGLICLFFALLGAGMLSQFIAKPIMGLTKHMKKVKEGNLDIEFQVNSEDEIGLLASGFNAMIRRVQELLTNINFEQKKKREYELALIQAQIKPHFLYNTLDVIYTLSEMGRTRDVQRTTKALADFYRAALSKGRETITIEEEVRNVKDYLSIQRIRYSDVFTFEFDIRSEVLGGLIPKLTIQPLVENAIYHGLKTKGSLGLLKVTGEIVEGKIKIIVSDDGVGMLPQRLEALVKKPESPEQAVGYGLRNVNDRIQLYFGDEYGLQIESQLGQGTEVTLWLPFQSEEG